MPEMRFTSKRHGRPLAIAGVIALTLTVTACGGQAAGSGTSAAGTGDSAAAAAFATKVAADVAAGTAAQTPPTNPVPTTGPTPVAGKQMVIIPCGAAVEGCARPAESAKQAAEAIGWSASIVDPAGAGGPSAAIQRAVSSGANGIILNSIDAAAVQGDLKAARDAGSRRRLRHVRQHR